MGKQKKEILKITEIKIRLPRKEIVLTCEEAREVAAELNKLLQLEKDKDGDSLAKLREEWEKMERNKPQKEYVPYPIYIERWPSYPPSLPYNPWTTWCRTDNTSHYDINGITTTSLSIDLTNNNQLKYEQ